MGRCGSLVSLPLMWTSALWCQYPVPSPPERPQGTSWTGVAALSDGSVEDFLFPSWAPSGLTFWANGCSSLCLLTWQAASVVHSNTGSNWTLSFLGIWLPGTETSRCHKLEGYFNSNFDEFLMAENRQVEDWKATGSWGLSGSPLFTTFTSGTWVSQVAQWIKNLPEMQEIWVRSLGQEDPLEEGLATHPSILPWRIP